MLSIVVNNVFFSPYSYYSGTFRDCRGFKISVALNIVFSYYSKNESNSLNNSNPSTWYYAKLIELIAEILVSLILFTNGCSNTSDIDNL